MELAVLPLRDGPLFPYTLAQLAIGRKRSLQAMLAALELDDPMLFVVAQRDDADDPAPEQLYEVGCIARILKGRRAKVGMELELQVLERARVDRWISGELAAVSGAPLPRDRSVDRLRVEVLAEEVLKAMSPFPPRRTFPLLKGASPGELAGVIVSQMHLSAEHRQQFLESDDEAQRVATVFDRKQLPFVGEGDERLGLLARLRRWARS